MSFSDRHGLVIKREIAQNNSMDDELRIDLWNASCMSFWGCFSSGNSISDSMGSSMVKLSNMEKLTEKVYAFLRVPINKRSPKWNDCLNFMNQEYNKLPWNKVYDFIELLLPIQIEGSENFVEAVNKALEINSSAYRVVSGEIVRVIDQEEINEIESLLISDDVLGKGAREHIRMALKKLSDREAPDYRNSIKESISAVESIATQLAPTEKTLGSALNKLSKKTSLHPALNKGFSNIYGYTNDEQGIRHSLIDGPSVTEPTARLMLIMCSSFCNYLIAEGEQL